MTLRYGNRKVTKMYAQINAHRKVVREQGTQDIQDTWDTIEEHIDFVYQTWFLQKDDAKNEN